MVPTLCLDSIVSLLRFRRWLPVYVLIGGLDRRLGVAYDEPFSVNSKTVSLHFTISVASYVVSGAGGGFTLACEELGRTLHHSFPACAFFYSED